MDNEMAVVAEAQYPLTANAVVARVRLIQDVMKAVMKEGTHYGIIPGCQKPSLWKPGAEQLLVTFRVAPDKPEVDNLSNEDSIRYRVTRVGRSPNGTLVAAGIGECSSDEEKYKWRRPVCDAEFEATPEDRKRLKFKRDGTTDKQIRTNPADVANTILKMADKRAYIAMALLATAASDIFTQDLEDLPPEVAESIEGAEPKAAPIKPPKAKSAATGNTVTFIPASVSAKTGEKNGKSWTRYVVKSPEGEWYGTFDENFGALANEAKAGQFALVVGFSIAGEYKNITTLSKAEPVGDAQE
jgi:hypothetical protein